jgi:hypothetical protein
MLKCRDIAKHSSEYVDKTLTLRQRLAFAFHLLICGKCREFIRQLRLALALYARMPAKELSQAEAEAVVKRVLEE